MIKNNYNDSLPLALDIKIGSLKKICVATDIWRVIYPGVDYCEGKRNRDRFSFLLIIIFNLYKIWSSSKYEYVAYSRNRNDYVSTSRYNPSNISFKAMQHITKLLISEGLVSHKIGFYSHESKNSRMKAAPMLIEMFTNMHNIPSPRLKNIKWNDTCAMSIKELKPVELLILRSEKTKQIKVNKEGKKKTVTKQGTKINYQDTPKTNQMRDELMQYNGILHNKEILFSSSVTADKAYVYYDVTKKTVKRTFNDGSWDSGGRFYGGFWQNCSSDLRKYILIEGRQTKEIDYKSHHIVILYSLVGKDYYDDSNYYGDAYTMEGSPQTEDTRTFFKQLMLSCINSKSELAAIKSMQFEINCSNKYGNKPLLLPAGMTISSAINSLKQKHEPISQYFFSGIGLKLQNIDSQITSGVLNDCTLNDIPVLSIHDSFICKKSDVDYVTIAMTRSMKSTILGLSGIDVTVKLKQLSY